MRRSGALRVVNAHTPHLVLRAASRLSREASAPVVSQQKVHGGIEVPRAREISPVHTIRRQLKVLRQVPFYPEKDGRELHAHAVGLRKTSPGDRHDGDASDDARVLGGPVHNRVVHRATSAAARRFLRVWGNGEKARAAVWSFGVTREST